MQRAAVRGRRGVSGPGVGEREGRTLRLSGTSSAALAGASARACAAAAASWRAAGVALATSWRMASADTGGGAPDPSATCEQRGGQFRATRGLARRRHLGGGGPRLAGDGAEAEAEHVAPREDVPAARRERGQRERGGGGRERREEARVDEGELGGLRRVGAGGCVRWRAYDMIAGWKEALVTARR